MGPRRRGWVVYSLIAALLAGSFAFTYWVLSQDAKKLERLSDYGQYFAQPEESKGGPVAAVPQTAPVEPRAAPDAMLVRRTFYAKCGNEVVTQGRIPADLAGLTQAELVARSKDSVIEEFTPTRIVLQETVDGLCPKHRNVRYLGISNDGMLAVFQGEPRSDSRPIETYDLDVAQLPDREVQDLRRGVPVTSEAELQRMLQSYLEQAGY